VIRQRLEALERLLLRPEPTCGCLLAFCPQEGQTRPPLDVVCDRCGLRRDPATTSVIEEVIVQSRAEAEAFFDNHRGSER
jgi:hypothetical protein